MSIVRCHLPPTNRSHGAARKNKGSLPGGKGARYKSQGGGNARFWEKCAAALIKQLHRFCVVFDQQTEQLKVPNLRLIERTTRAEGLKGHIYELTPEGQTFLKTAGIL